MIWILLLALVLILLLGSCSPQPDVDWEDDSQDTREDA